MSHTFLARIIHGEVELCLLKIIQEILTDRNDAVLNHLSLLIEESGVPFFKIYFEEGRGGMGTMADPFGRSCEPHLIALDGYYHPWFILLEVGHAGAGLVMPLLVFFLVVVG